MTHGVMIEKGIREGRKLKPILRINPKNIAFCTKYFSEYVRSAANAIAMVMRLLVRLSVIAIVVIDTNGGCTSTKAPTNAGTLTSALRSPYTSSKQLAKYTTSCVAMAGNRNSLKGDE
jgi:hypothetical protein